jgi:cytidine deaminase
MTESEKIELINGAKTVQEYSYAPYSKLHVGAAVKGEDGKIYTGTNVENASYGLTICAERAAIFNAVAHGIKKVKLIAITSDNIKFIPPCGACRQVIREFSDDDTMIIMAGANGEVQVKSISELLPLSFIL